MEDPPATIVGSEDVVHSGVPEAAALEEDMVHTISVPCEFEANVIEVTCALEPLPPQPFNNTARVRPNKLRGRQTQGGKSSLADTFELTLIPDPVLRRNSHIAQLQLHADQRKALQAHYAIGRIQET